MVRTQAFHFAEFQKRRCFLHSCCVGRFARRLEGLQQGEVLLQAAVDALLVKREELELPRLEGENVRGGEGRVDLRDIGASLTSILKLLEGEEVVFDGANQMAGEWGAARSAAHRYFAVRPFPYRRFWNI
jgi:hypothetical protein